ncbi:Protein detoxification 21 [Vitis vinifera]|uniref:Protein detoxification 21 n=1 Tax=Vitis vinifera TaxID=29760 RepID=A0A438FS25_VITVI|nr:Protein detoxification 21 [Vitis vinifera]
MINLIRETLFGIKYSIKILSLELWYNTVLILLTGNLKNARVAIDALSICININGWEMMISLGFMAAASVRISNELGRGSSKAAKFSIVTTVITSFSIGFVLFIFFLFLRGRLAYIFTDSQDVAKAGSRSVSSIGLLHSFEQCSTSSLR